MTPEQSDLVERIRALLTGEAAVREVSMFGGRSFMVNEKMIVSVRKDGGLLVRVAADRQDELAARPGARHAQMGAGRDMGPGWIQVDPGAIADEQGLASWVALALEHNRAVTGG